MGHECPGNDVVERERIQFESRVEAQESAARRLCHGPPEIPLALQENFVLRREGFGA